MHGDIVLKSLQKYAMQFEYTWINSVHKLF